MQATDIQIMEINQGLRISKAIQVAVLLFDYIVIYSDR
jgi:hypothetical protein